MKMLLQPAKQRASIHSPLFSDSRGIVVFKCLFDTRNTDEFLHF